MQHTALADLPTVSAPEAYFSGKVWLQTLTSSAARVTFTPSARTAWHTHPNGQTLIVLSGTGLVQKRGEEVITFSAGDVVQIEAGEEHWHGAAPDSLMVHLALQVGAAEWLAKVTDAEYQGK